MIRAVLAVLASSLVGCAVKGPEEMSRIPWLAGATEVYTLTNLHPDDPRPVLYTTNYQRAGLIPVCTRVKIVSLSPNNEMRFQIAETGKEYAYAFHRGVGEKFEGNIARYFGTECPKEDIAKLSEVDQGGIERGVADVGMSKMGVIYAIGYPPHRGTPDLEGNVWRYWRNKLPCASDICRSAPFNPGAPIPTSGTSSPTGPQKSRRYATDESGTRTAVGTSRPRGSARGTDRGEQGEARSPRPSSSSFEGPGATMPRGRERRRAARTELAASRRESVALALSRHGWQA